MAKGLGLGVRDNGAHGGSAKVSLMAAAADHLEDALELADLAERMVRARLRREHPGWSEDELDARVLAWLHERPGAEHGDAEGVAVKPPFRTPSR